MTLKTKVKNILLILDEFYGSEDKCYLNYTKDYELLIATILSAQCTDDRVNTVTKSLFEKYNSLEKFAIADLREMEEDIKSTGFYHNKAKNIIKCSQKLISEYNSQVPEKVEDLIKLDGVGRKTANVVRSHIFNLPSIVVDTHVKRISNRWGFVDSEDPVKIEFALMEILPKEHWIRYNTQVIAHGRKICTSRSPKCRDCMFTKYCDYYKK